METTRAIFIIIKFYVNFAIQSLVKLKNVKFVDFYYFNLPALLRKTENEISTSYTSSWKKQN